MNPSLLLDAQSFELPENFLGDQSPTTTPASKLTEVYICHSANHSLLTHNEHVLKCWDSNWRRRKA